MLQGVVPLERLAPELRNPSRRQGHELWSLKLGCGTLPKTVFRQPAAARK